MKKVEKGDNSDTVSGTSDDACKISSMAVSEGGACSNGKYHESVSELGEQSKINYASKASKHNTSGCVRASLLGNGNSNLENLVFFQIVMLWFLEFSICLCLVDST